MISGYSGCCSIKCSILRIIHICFRYLARTIKEPVIFRTVGRCTQDHISSFNLSLKFTQDISFWSHLRRIPASQLAGIHFKSVMMLCYRNYKLSSGFLKQFCPLRRIKLFSLKHGNKIFISEFIQCAIFFYMVKIFSRSFFIHIPWIPFISKCRNTVYAPVDKNSKLSFFIPYRCRMLTQGIPCICVRSP